MKSIRDEARVLFVVGAYLTLPLYNRPPVGTGQPIHQSDGEDYDGGS